MGIFDIFKKKNSSPTYTKSLDLISRILKESEYVDKGYSFDLNMKNSSSYKEMKEKSDIEKTEFLLDCMTILIDLSYSKHKIGGYFINGDGPISKKHSSTYIITLIKNNCRSKFLLGEYAKINELILTLSMIVERIDGIYDFPIPMMLKKVTQSLNAIDATNDQKNRVKDNLLSMVKVGKFHYIKRQIEDYLKKHYNKRNDSEFSLTSPFGKSLKDVLGQNTSTLEWLVKHQAVLRKVTGSKPTKAFNKVFSNQSDKEKQIHRLAGQNVLTAFIALKENDFVESHTRREYSWVSRVDNNEFNDHQNIVKGVVWSLSIFSDKETLECLYKTASRSYKKIANVGQTATAIGNACMYSLATSRGMGGLSKLVALKLAVKQPSTKKLADKYLVQESEKSGVTASQLEEMAFQDYNYEKGEKVISFDDYQLKVNIVGLGKVEQLWIKPDQKTQKSIPSFVKVSSGLSLKLKKVKAEIKDVQRSTTVLKDRLENSYLEDGILSYDRFLKNYLDHGVGYQIVSTLIWNIINGEDMRAGIWCADHWETVEGRLIRTGVETKVQLWHPLNSNRDTVVAWREYLLNHEIKQPFKQAYREVYVVTPPEITTKTYSNRMAAHIIKQHQFNALASGRGWKHTLIGAWDHGFDCIARKHLTKYDINCQFWLVDEGYYEDTTDAGVMLYLGTDQVRFEKDGSALNLEDVPKIVFSEIMRDADLFVGVASVGNDPEWSDNQGDNQRRAYWSNYSFGDLNEVAKTRKEVLQMLIPRLKIRDVAIIKDKFLIVKGKIRTYKIHLGSTNILMTPNDQYLCIVPDGRKKESKLFLPFEGDRGLSIIISKALMLADDNKIKDDTILRQISRKI